LAAVSQIASSGPRESFRRLQQAKSEEHEEEATTWEPRTRSTSQMTRKPEVSFPIAD